MANVSFGQIGEIATQKVNISLFRFFGISTGTNTGELSYFFVVANVANTRSKIRT